MKKNIGLFLMIVLLLTITSGCKFQRNNQQNSSTSSAVPSTVTSSMSSSSQANSGYYGTKDEKLISILKSVIPKGSNIVYFYSGDFEGNKKSEAFAFVGTNDNSNIDADLWFVTANGAKDIFKSYQNENNAFQPYIWTVGDIKMLKFESYGVSGTASYVWVVQNGNPIQCGIGMEMTYSGDGKNFDSTGQDFDWGTDTIYNSNDSSFTSSSGHTYKEYYFYWNGSAFKEYGGIKISLEQLLAVNGAKQIIDQIQSKGYQIEDIFYRSNNIININYKTNPEKNVDSNDKDFSITNDNATLLYQNNTVKLVNANDDSTATLENSDYGGIYSAALNPSIASYPSKFPLE